VAFGYLVDHYQSYTLPFIPMALMLLLGAAFWLRVDPTKPLAAASTQELGGVPASIT
jgi:hypothetical protein